MSVLISPDYVRRIPPCRIVPEPRGPVAYIDCVTCGRQGVWHFSNGAPAPEIVHRHFTRQGWDIGKKRATCPECLEKAKLERQQRKEERAMTTVTPIKPSDNPTPSDAAKKAKRLVYMMLEDVFNDTAGLYKQGQSDATVAAECGVSEAFVKKIREEDFGALKLPPEIQALQDDLAMAIATTEDVACRLQALIKKQGWIA